eukprot:CAMPEP_0117752230 /NCGR_PEP_ID=MMETSP0947-20121206/11482_1 /TAXON_ID=44440 /ORGANISM="Chattonella subsalsa, Strain CCMP2191" /LENGTH=136 /DNA_ID=CAMNT_0005570833 /DNA_START=155 /DNA_END=565 /DNA_ORIENTATION=-
MIPSKYTCDGDDVSPPLQWAGVPVGTVSLALTLDDPDAPMGIWDHWVVFNIPSSTSGFVEDIQDFPLKTQFGSTSWGETTYGGPCPPSSIHQYVFSLYALNAEISLGDGISKDQLIKAMSEHILDSTTLIGKYGRH